MHAAMFQTPFMPPTRSARETFTWAVEQAVVCDQAGLSEYWIGEHATQAWESIPNPELVIAAAALQTEQIRLAPGAHLLPYHHPATLAVQIAYLTQVTQGRYILGIGAGAFPEDAALRGLKDLTENHRMVTESLEIMRRVWRKEPFQFEGDYWRAGYPEAPEGHPLRDVGLYNGTIEIGLTGLSPNSPSLRFAGQNGYLPLSIYSGDDFLRNHWETYSTAAQEKGRIVDRSVHHVVRDVFIADTDKEARRWAIEGGMGKAWQEYVLPRYHNYGILETMIKNPGMSADDVDLDYLADNVWIVGSPETAVEKLEEAFAATGGWGTIMMYGYDYIDNPEPWNHSIELLSREVAPKVSLPA
ncbi:Putative monooxygenase [Frankia alni ACN14a]|uniref:Monooxygenase n=2 Tax=Frankiaceae TaxID=74712 RepID=Q0RMT2_FRAAA|nr:Putative monooxygenase [Frankia alni ACN14a]